jgi:hypothetical protein
MDRKCPFYADTLGEMHVEVLGGFLEVHVGTEDFLKMPKGTLWATP